MESALAFGGVTLIKHPQSHTGMLSGRQLDGTHQDWTMEQAKMTAEWTDCVQWLGWLPSLFSFNRAGMSLLASPSEQPLTPRDGMWKKYSRKRWSISSNFQMFFFLNSRNPIMGLPVFKILQGKPLMYSGSSGCCCQGAAHTGVQQSARKKQARHTWQVLLKWDSFHQIVINKQTPLKKMSWKPLKGKHPFSGTTSKSSRPYSIISDKFSLLKHREHEVIKGYLWDAVCGKCFAKCVWLYKAPVLIRGFLLPKHVDGCMCSCNTLIYLNNIAAYC